MRIWDFLRQESEKTRRVVLLAALKLDSRLLANSGTKPERKAANSVSTFVLTGLLLTFTSLLLQLGQQMFKIN